MFWNETEALVAQQCEVLTATELFTCKRLISHYANFTSLKLKKKKLAQAAAAEDGRGAGPDVRRPRLLLGRKVACGHAL